MNNDIINLLNVKEADIEEYYSKITNGVLIIHLKLKKRIERCPKCDSHHQIIKEYKIKDINHPILNGMKCVIKYKCRRYVCKECGTTFNESNSFVSPRQRSTNYIIKSVMDLLKSTNETYQSVSLKTNISSTEVEKIFDTHYSPFFNQLPEVLSIDEIHNPQTGVGVYDCVLLDFETRKIIDYLPDRSSNFLANYFTKRRKKELKNVKYVSIDMWEPYRNIAKRYMKNAIICVDSFHVIENICRAFDKVRIRVTAKYPKESTEYYLLKKFLFLLRMRQKDIPYNKPKYNHKLDNEVNLQDILELQLKVDKELAKAYYCKELYCWFNQNTKLEKAQEELHKMIKMFQDSNVDEYVDIYKMLINWFDEIVNSFTILPNGSRINNGVIERKNKDIGKLIFNANGVSNPNRLRARIMYIFNDDNYSIDELENVSKGKGNKRGKYKKNNY